MPASQRQLEANRRNAQKSTGPRTPEGKNRASLNAWRHGLTGQVATLPDEDRHAFEKFTRDIRQAYSPVGALEVQIAQSIAEDEWRLNRARAIENNVLALGIDSADGDIEAANSQIHAAMSQARTFWRSPEKFALLSLYEQRIARRVHKSEERLRALQADRKATAPQPVETKAAVASNGFVSSTPAAPLSTPAVSAAPAFPNPPVTFSQHRSLPDLERASESN